jgi:hypothetical protein
MKRKPEALSKVYMPLILWREDLEDLLSVIARRNGAVEIVKGDYIFETLDELAAHAGSRDETNLAISSSKPYSQIELRPWQARVFVAADDATSGIFYEIDKVLTSCQRRIPFLYSYWTVNTITTAVILLSFFAGWSVSHAGMPGYFSLIPLLLLGWTVWVLFVRLKRNSVIRLERRVDRKSFFRRKKDELALIIISALTGAGLGVAGTMLAGYFHK